MNRQSNFREMISGENGIISSKRVMGVLTLLVCMGCTIWLVISEGGTQVVENLLQTLMIMAAALLGLSTVTGIWRHGKDKTIKHEDLIEEDKEETHKFDPDDPCKSCIHNTKKAAE